MRAKQEIMRARKHPLNILCITVTVENFEHKTNI